MTKGRSEGLVRAALAEMGVACYVYKPPDDARNWKPADFLVWFTAGLSSWVEVKDTPAVRGFPLADLRPSQRIHIARAGQLGIPYFLVIHWERTHDWTISDAVKVLEWEASQEVTVTSIPRTLLQTRFGVQTAGRLLPGTLKAALLGEL